MARDLLALILSVVVYQLTYDSSLWISSGATVFERWCIAGLLQLVTMAAITQLYTFLKPSGA